MHPLSPSRIARICLAGAAALVLAAPASARVEPTYEGDSIVAPTRSVPATVAKSQSNVAQYGWGAAATFAKEQTLSTLAAFAENELLAQYGWGAAATYAKLHSASQ